LCKNQNIRLITIFEDEWLENSKVVTSTLSHILNNNKSNFGARQTTVKIIDSENQHLFLEQYHVMGAPNNPTISLGAFHKSKLVAVMTFNRMGNSIPKRFAEQYHHGWNLSRFATAGISIPGIASKLLKQFIVMMKQENRLDLIITFADARWSDGKLYHTLGFQADGYDPPSYWYTKNQKRYHKFGFRKSQLERRGYDPLIWTEKDAMKDLGYDRIWDCGKYRFFMDLR
jgi:hypothetical protein